MEDDEQQDLIQYLDFDEQIDWRNELKYEVERRYKNIIWRNSVGKSTLEDICESICHCDGLEPLDLPDGEVTDSAVELTGNIEEAQESIENDWISSLTSSYEAIIQKATNITKELMVKYFFGYLYKLSMHYSTDMVVT